MLAGYAPVYEIRGDNFLGFFKRRKDLLSALQHPATVSLSLKMYNTFSPLTTVPSGADSSAHVDDQKYEGITPTASSTSHQVSILNTLQTIRRY